MNHIPHMLINRAEASDFIQSVDDPQIKLILELAQYQAYRSFLPVDGVDEETMLKQLPASQFDMLYFVKMVANLIRAKSMIVDILSGKMTDQDLRDGYA
jgi:hypothetical protein